MPAPTPAPDPDRLAGFVLCRGGLEEVVVKELRELEIEVVARRKRAVEIVTNLAGFYRANMGLRSALNVLRPIRSFNARNYDLLYYQSRKTNWHKLFPVDARIRIDIKGHSPKITHTRYAIHRVKDGITDTFRKLCHGVRPSIEKRNPDVHVVVYLEKHRATLALDMSGTPLFKRGYRIEHGEAPMKEDLAAGLLSLSGWDRRSPLLDPMCGSGTLLFEAWMMAAGIAPNLHRRFGFEALHDYDPQIHDAERRRLEARQSHPEGMRLLGIEIDQATFRTLEKIRARHFPEAPIQLEHGDFRNLDPGDEFGAAVCNPPYGLRSGEEFEITPLYQALGTFLRRHFAGRCAGIYTANHEAAPHFGGDPGASVPLLNGSLEGRLYRIALDAAG
ncbi:MAG TPA: hypothetical protein DCS85_01250 [Verrucomicrobiales bacterium]|jgi:putative N6-adenine-specific DNA methylase|nr:hypothetical protein [Deltaproteobacteria bacterium]HAT18759.1 hypothetical protein [Verrucomicrobiales bacterium]